MSSEPYGYRRSSSTESRGSTTQNGFGLNFELPRINIQNITQSFTNRSFTPPNFGNFMSFRQSSQPRSSSASARDRPTEAAACELCGSKFNLLKRRKNCSECSVDYCNACFTKDNPVSDVPRRGQCRRCRVFNMQPLDRRTLMSLRVKDLRWYLSRKRVPAHLCKEKSDLVDLILQHNGYSTTTAESSYNASRSRSNSRQASNSRPAESASTDTSSSNEDGNSWVIVNDEDAEPTPESTPASGISSSGPTLLVKNEVTASTEDFKPFNIDDLDSEVQVQSMSVRQMKLVLTRNFVDYKGCCEKDELLDKVMRLWREKREASAQNPDDISDENCCKICMEAVIDCVLLECGHMVTCTNCGKRLNECPICRQYVIRAVRIFKS